MYKKIVVVLEMLILIGLPGCKKKQQPDPAPQPAKSVTSPTAGKPGASKPGASKPQASAPEAETEPAPVVYTPLKTQIGHKATEIKPKGWVGKGDRFVIQTWRVPFVLGSEDAEETTDLKLIEVHETITGKTVGSYRVHWEEAGNAEGSWEASWKEARPKGEWKTFVEENPLVEAKSSPQAPGGGWSLSAKPAKTYRGLKIKPDKLGVSYSWNLATGGKTKPSIDVFLEPKEGAPVKVLRFQVPIGPAAEEDEGAGDAELVTGRVDPYWSPDGQHVLLLLGAKNDSEQSPQLDARFYVRSLGPQLQLTTSKKNQLAARRAGQRLARAGLPVTRLVVVDKQQPETVIYYRGEHKTHAETAAKAIGGSCKVEELKTAGWLHLVILHGG